MRTKPMSIAFIFVHSPRVEAVFLFREAINADANADADADADADAKYCPIPSSK